MTLHTGYSLLGKKYRYNVKGIGAVAAHEINSNLGRATTCPNIVYKLHIAKIKEDDGMGIMGIGSPSVQTITFRKADGTVSGTMGTSKSSGKKKKKLNYNYKEISGQLMRARTSISARLVLSRAFDKVGMLRRKLKSGQYNEKEVEKAIAHAEQIAQVARKRMKHLQEEERLKRGGPCEAEMEEEKEEFRLEDLDLEQLDDVELDSEEMRKLMEELEETLEELEDMDGLEELTGAVQEDMDPEDLELLKKKHRAKELKEIMEADMKYLKALFNELERERREGISSVSLEIAGMEMPTPVVEMPVAAEGGSIDVMV